MADKQSYANQLGWTITTRDYLNNLNSELRYISNQYGNMLRMLREGNYVTEELNIIQRQQNEFSESTKDLIQYIEQEHLEYIERQAKIIREDIATLS